MSDRHARFIKCNLNKLQSAMTMQLRKIVYNDLFMTIVLSRDEKKKLFDRLFYYNFINVKF